MSESTNQDSGVGAMSLDDAASLMDSRDAEETQDEDQEEASAEPEEGGEEEVEGEHEQEEQEEESDPEEVEAQFEEVEHEGKKYAVPKELKDSFLRQADYTKKTTEVAEQRRALEAHAQSISEERNFYANQLKGFVESLNTTVQQMPTEAQLAEMAKTDPLGYIQARAARDELMIKQHQAQQAQEYLTKQQQAEDKKAYDEMLKHEYNSLMTKLPEWKNEKVAAKEHAQIADYLLGEGYTKDDVEGLTDSKAVVIARKAMLYDKMVKGAAKQPAQQKPAAKILAPGKQGTGQPKQVKEIAQRFKQSHSIDDALALLNSRTRG